MSYAYAAVNARHLLASTTPRRDAIRDIALALEETAWLIAAKGKKMAVDLRKTLFPKKRRHRAEVVKAIRQAQEFTMPKFTIIRNFREGWAWAMSEPLPYQNVGKVAVGSVPMSAYLPPEEIITDQIPMQVIAAEPVIDKWVKLKKARPTPLTVAPYFVRKPSWAKRAVPAMAGSRT